MLSLHSILIQILSLLFPAPYLFISLETVFSVTCILKCDTPGLSLAPQKSNQHNKVALLCHSLSIYILYIPRFGL